MRSGPVLTPEPDPRGIIWPAAILCAVQRVREPVSAGGPKIAPFLTFPPRARPPPPSRAAQPGGMKHPVERRVVADATNHSEWLRARAQGVTATDAAKLASRASIRAVAREKQYGSSFGGNRYSEHGRSREPIIAEWVKQTHGMSPSSRLFHAEHNRRHLATPDGMKVTPSGGLELCEIKTCTRAWLSIPRHYLRQVWWQQYVLGAERTLVVWEQHEDFVPVAPEPRTQWVSRDEDQIAILVHLADELIAELGGKWT